MKFDCAKYGARFWNFEILCRRVLEFRNSTSCKFRLNFKICSDRILKFYTPWLDSASVS
ncbi:hypothetical protein [uncultured Campylobacter sp.]|uniref:hypothetical protein n=1 Tax=uncultured Campylobacter sp. TaxID=218934 RepID=UPI0026265FA9|nr:hypothetical protein [uncultured Campylobacter sp.]